MNLVMNLQQKINAIDPEYFNRRSVTLHMVKEDAKRNKDFDPTEPIELEWVPRFSFRLPLKETTPKLDVTHISDITSIATLPVSLNQRVAELLVEHTTIKEPRSHHYKQWIGISYSTNHQNKVLQAGFRFISVTRPYSKREVTWCGGEIPKIDTDTNHTVPQKAFDEVMKHLKEDIGIHLTEENINNLRISENYFVHNIDHVWAY